ncbi:hypothetical protein L9W92_04280 [Pelotomaculum terephthalicicum JT]|uniref:hypothetical protein n=1 Tax=Pelotomaculum terephthalicicum TaxID=206393 RepID=UPI001F04E77D|nr:hypothetical protein [Pelotomaculum terephthalicicum]MCG9967272.1 hypothetical protein [Pelotomaculum terephthalicicum JT]
MKNETRTSVAPAAVLALKPPVLIPDEVMFQRDKAGRRKKAAALERLKRSENS